MCILIQLKYYFFCSSAFKSRSNDSCILLSSNGIANFFKVGQNDSFCFNSRGKLLFSVPRILDIFDSFLLFSQNDPLNGEVGCVDWTRRVRFHLVRWLKRANSSIQCCHCNSYAHTKILSLLNLRNQRL